MGPSPEDGYAHALAISTKSVYIMPSTPEEGNGTKDHDPPSRERGGDPATARPEGERPSLRTTDRNGEQPGDQGSESPATSRPNICISNVVVANETAYRYTLTQMETTRLSLSKVTVPSMREDLESQYDFQRLSSPITSCGACMTESGLFFLIACANSLAAVIYDCSARSFAFHTISESANLLLALCEDQAADFTGELSMADLGGGVAVVHLNGSKACFSVSTGKGPRVQRLHDLPYPVDHSLLVPGAENCVWLIAGTIVSPLAGPEESESLEESEQGQAGQIRGKCKSRRRDRHVELITGGRGTREAGPIHSCLTYCTVTRRWVALSTPAYQAPREACAISLLSRYLIVLGFLDDDLWVCDIEAAAWSRITIDEVTHEKFTLCGASFRPCGAQRDAHGATVCGCSAALRLERDLSQSEVLFFKYWGQRCLGRFGSEPRPGAERSSEAAASTGLGERSEALLKIELASLPSKIAVSALSRPLERLLSVGWPEGKQSGSGDSTTSSGNFAAAYSRRKALMQQRESLHRCIVRHESELHSISAELASGVTDDIVLSMEAENLAADLKNVGYWLRLAGIDSGRRKPLKAVGRSIPAYATLERYSAGEAALLSLVTQRQALEKRLMRLKRERDSLREELVDLRRSMSEVDRELHPEERRASDASEKSEGGNESKENDAQDLMATIRGDAQIERPKAERECAESPVFSAPSVADPTTGSKLPQETSPRPEEGSPGLDVQTSVIIGGQERKLPSPDGGEEAAESTPASEPAGPQKTGLEPLPENSEGKARPHGLPPPEEAPVS